MPFALAVWTHLSSSIISHASYIQKTVRPPKELNDIIYCSLSAQEYVPFTFAKLRLKTDFPNLLTYLDSFFFSGKQCHYTNFQKK